ncbi:MAG: hypothetical protein ACK443_08495 [Methylococcaceae bacterium]|jgi:hypothetical protein
MISQQTAWDVPTVAGETSVARRYVRYSPRTPEFFSIRYIGHEALLLSAAREPDGPILIQFSSGAVLLVTWDEVEPL